DLQRRPVVEIELLADSLADHADEPRGLLQPHHVLQRGGKLPDEVPEEAVPIQGDRFLRDGGARRGVPTGVVPDLRSHGLVLGGVCGRPATASGFRDRQAYILSATKSRPSRRPGSPGRDGGRFDDYSPTSVSRNRARRW